MVPEVLEILTSKKEKGKSVVVALEGDLGAGKTTFTQELARVLGITEVVVSPTYVLMKRYSTENELFSELIHMDAYRIEDIDELRVLHFAELLEVKDTMICIEWASNIAAALPKEYFQINLTQTSEEGRKLELTYVS